jgi:hypothetical protein
MRRSLMLALLVLTLAAGVAASLAVAGGPPDPPNLDCHHGNSGKPCRPDPQPGHGNDCSNPSGGNQDHCAGESTTSGTTSTGSSTISTTSTSSTGSTSTSRSTTTATTSTSLSTSTGTTTTGSQSVAKTTTVTNPVTTDEVSDTTTTATTSGGSAPPETKTLSRERVPAAKAKRPSEPTGELANTGLPLWLIGLAGLGMIAFGLMLTAVGARYWRRSR